MVDVLQVVLAYVAADVLQVAHITVLAHVEDAEEDVEIAIKMMSSNYYMIQIAGHNNSWQEGSSKEITFIVTKDCHLPQAPGRRVIEDAESVKSLADQLLLPRWFDSPMAPLRRAPQRLIGDIRFCFHRFIRDWNDRQYKLKCRLLESDSKTVAFLHKLYNYLRHYGKQNM